MEDLNDLRILAVEEDDLNSLLELADSSDWFHFVDPKSGNTLLHFAVMYNRKEIFDYLMAIEDLSINQKNDAEETVLDVCLRRSSTPRGYFACQLIQRGASLDCSNLTDGDTLLHQVIRNGFVEVSKMLIKLGHDVNAQNDQGVTPIWTCLKTLYSREDTLEIASALLSHGADPALGQSGEYNAFEYAINKRLSPLGETLFDFMVDDHTSIDVHFSTLVVLSQERSPYFSTIIERSKSVIAEDFPMWHHDFLLTMDIEDLDLLIKKYPDALRETFHQIDLSHFSFSNHYEKFFKNLYRLIDSELRDDTVDFIRSLENPFKLFCDPKPGEPLAVEYLSFLLSYGLKLDEDDLIYFYEMYGFGELIRMLLYMDIEKGTAGNFRSCRLLQLVYDVRCDLEQILKEIEGWEITGDLLPYFSDAKLRRVCSGAWDPEVLERSSSQPKVPLLVELSRNTFRKHFIQMCNITTAKKFYTLLKRLCIAPVHRDIISFARRLY